MTGDRLPSTLIRALRTSKRPSPSLVWYSYLERIVPCIFTGVAFSVSLFSVVVVCCAEAVAAARHSRADVIAVLILCYVLFLRRQNYI